MTVRSSLGTLAPTSWREAIVWAAKVFVSVFVATLGVDALTELVNTDFGPELDAAQVAAVAAVAAVGNFVLNAALAWATPTPS